MEEYFTLVVAHFELYNSEQAHKKDWIEWCWENVGQNNFNWTLDVHTDMHQPTDYVYHIRFKNEGDKVLFILNWL